MKEVVLKVSNLNKSYDNQKTFTVREINFEIFAGDIVGLVGRNGVGKSTIIKSITGVLPFEMGEISIAGFDVKNNPIDAKKCLGYVPDVCNAFDKMTGMEYLNFIGDIFNISKREREEKIKMFEDYFSLGEKIHSLISSYSHGMKQKISLMASLLPSPKLWVLDEPTTGLDPQTQSSLLDYIVDYAKKGNSVLFSSHSLDIVEKVCNKVIIIHKGTIVSNSSVKEALANAGELDKYFKEKVK